MWYGLGHRGTMAHTKAGFAFHVAFWHARISTWEIGKRSARDRQGLAPAKQQGTRQRHDKAQRVQHISSKRAGM